MHWTPHGGVPHDQLSQYPAGSQHWQNGHFAVPGTALLPGQMARYDGDQFYPQVPADEGGRQGSDVCMPWTPAMQDPMQIESHYGQGTMPNSAPGSYYSFNFGPGQQQQQFLAPQGNAGYSFQQQTPPSDHQPQQFVSEKSFSASWQLER